MPSETKIMNKRIKANTLQQRLGFMDEDLKKPSHDVIIKWVCDNAGNLFEDILYKKDYSQDEIEYIKEQTIKAFCGNFHKKNSDIKRYGFSGNIPDHEKVTFADINFSDRIPEKSKVEVYSLQWEYLIRCEAEKSYSGYKPHAKDIGFVDLKIDLKIPRLGLSDVKIDRSRLVNKSTKGAWFDISNYRPTYMWKEDFEIVTLMIEAKTVMPTLGELFRQLNLYRNYFKEGIFVIVCPDDSQRKVIEDQGYLFLKYLK